MYVISFVLASISRGMLAPPLWFRACCVSYFPGHCMEHVEHGICRLRYFIISCLQPTFNPDVSSIGRNAECQELCVDIFAYLHCLMFGIWMKYSLNCLFIHSFMYLLIHRLTRRLTLSTFRASRCVVFFMERPLMEITRSPFLIRPSRSATEPVITLLTWEQHNSCSF